MISCPDFKHRCVVRTAVAFELAELYASRSIQTYFGCHLIIETYVHLLESLVGTWSIHPIVPECAANAHRKLWQPIVVNVKAARNSVVTNVTGIEVGRGIKLAHQEYFPGQCITCPQPRVKDVEPRGRACVGVCPQSCRIEEAV